MNDITAIKKKIENTEKAKIDSIDSNQIGEFAKVKIDTNAPIQTRFMKFMKEVENPYIFKSGDLIVKMEYADNDLNLEKCIERIVKNKM